MAGNRRHLPVQDTPSATPSKKILAECQLHFQSTKLSLKNRFPRGHRPTPQQRLGLAKDLERAASELFEATARATLPRLPVSTCATALQHVAERVTVQAVSTWNELSHKYRLVWVIQEPAKQRARLRQALPSDRELPPIDAIDIKARLHKLLTGLADKLEREVCEKAVLPLQLPDSDEAKSFAVERERKEGVAKTPLDAVEGQQPADPNQPKVAETAAEKPSDIATDGGSAEDGSAEVVASDEPNPPIRLDGESQAIDPNQPKMADIEAECSTGKASDDLGESEKLANAPEQPPTLMDETDPTNKGRRGDERILGTKRVVNFKEAEAYLGITDRHRLNLMKSGALTVEGKGRRRMITSASLRDYLPPE
jgi:hypothetical protein